MDFKFLKLGGSLITDKTAVEAPRLRVLDRLAYEIRKVLNERPEMKLIIGHGSGSFGHVAAAEFGTRQGVDDSAEWRGFAQVSDAAARLNSLVRRSLLNAGVPAITIQPSASVMCDDGQITSMGVAPIESALRAKLVPLIYGDVAFDKKRGGTIVSTEEVLVFLADRLNPEEILLAGEVDGVLDAANAVVNHITPDNVQGLLPILGGSRGTDVTGGMAGKVLDMVGLVENNPMLSVFIFSALKPDRLRDVLLGSPGVPGTLISAD